MPAVLIATLLRLFASCGVAAPLAASGQLHTELHAWIAGLSAPLIVARLFQLIPVGADQVAGAAIGDLGSAGLPSGVTSGGSIGGAAAESGGPDAPGG